MSLPLSNCPMCGVPLVPVVPGNVGEFVCDSIICRDELLAVLGTRFSGKDGLARKISDILADEERLNELRDDLEGIRETLIELAGSIRDDAKESKERSEKLKELKERLEEIEREEVSATRDGEFFERAEALVDRLNRIKIP